MPLLAKLNVLRGLRFRLTITNSIFLIGLLIAVGFFFRGVLSRILDNQVRDILQEEWVAVKSYLVIHKREPNWRPDPDDPEETLAVQRLQRVFLLADAKGKVIEVSPIYEDLGVQTPAEIMQALALKEEFWQDKRSSEGEPFRLRGGAFIDDDEQTYFVVIGRSMYGSETVLAEFTKDYFMLLPGLIISGILLGWIVAGRAISPVHALARTAEAISSNNLSLRIPLRRTGDELDNLSKTFNSMVERLERSFQMTRQFSTDVSHELRTPLTAIRGQLEVALLTAKHSEQYREAMINALEDVERLTRTVRAMLLLSQAESGQLELQKGVLDLSPIVEDIVDQFQIPAEEAQVDLRAEQSGAALIDAARTAE
jgi:signal transduction histidine kinase